MIGEMEVRLPLDLLAKDHDFPLELLHSAHFGSASRISLSPHKAGPELSQGPLWPWLSLLSLHLPWVPHGKGSGLLEDPVHSPEPRWALLSQPMLQ